jgi:hypothetical protein
MAHLHTCLTCGFLTLGGQEYVGIDREALSHEGAPADDGLFLRFLIGAGPDWAPVPLEPLVGDVEPATYAWAPGRLRNWEFFPITTHRRGRAQHPI